MTTSDEQFWGTACLTGDKDPPGIFQGGLEISRILEFSRGPGNFQDLKISRLPGKFQGLLKAQDPGNFQIPDLILV